MPNGSREGAATRAFATGLTGLCDFLVGNNGARNFDLDLGLSRKLFGGRILP